MKIEKIKYKKMYNFIFSAFKSIGLNNQDSAYVSEGLINASLRGVDSHGVRLLKHYILSGINGRKNTKPKYKFFKKYKTSLLINADNGYGLAACRRGLEKSLKIVDKYGVACTAVVNSSHCGCLASSVIPISKKGYMVLGFTHADSLLLSTNSSKAYFGTNPLCFAFPRKNKEPFCLDMSPSLFSWNKVLTYRSQNKKLPKNICADINGKMTTDPNKAASLIPIGDYKGYALASMIEILCSIITGMNFGKNIPKMFDFDIKKTRNLGQMFIVFKTDLFSENKSIFKNLERMYKDVSKLPKKKSNLKILLPNDRESSTLVIRKKEGIEISKELKNDFIYISNLLKIENIL